MWFAKDCPCHKCESRHSICHAHCEAYIEFREHINTVRNNEHKVNAVDIYNAPMRAKQKDFYSKKKKEGAFIT